MQSEKIDLLVKALIKAKSEFSKVEKQRENPFYKSKYADLGTIDEAVTPALHKNGLAVIQTTAISGIQPVLVTTLAHESGQFITGEYPLNPVKNDPQALGSATTYARRYSLSAMLTVVADDDDDGNAASAPATAKTHAVAKTTAPTEPPTSGKPVISEAQGKRLYAMWKQAHRQDDEVKQYIKVKYGLNSTREITKDIYESVCEWVNSGQPAVQPDPEIQEVPF